MRLKYWIDDVPFQSQQVIVCVHGYVEQNMGGFGREMEV
jgi:hypothetical protein